MKELIKKLTEAYGPSGYENDVMNMIKEEIKDYVDDLKIDKMGNLVALKQGKGNDRKKIMFAAHADEIGLMVTHIEKEGFLRFTNIGGINPYNLVGARIKLQSGQKGMVSHEHLDSMKDLKLEKMYMDIGSSSEEESKKIVSLGDIAVYDQKTQFIDGRIMGKAIDDRIGCAVLIETAKQVGEVDNDIFLVFTVQEEVGLRGGRTSAYSINPDLGIAVDVTRTGDTPGAKRMDVALGKGVAIKIKDSSLITSQKVKKLIIDTAERENIKYQLEVLERGGTDAGAINLAREGIPAGCLSLPCRYVHSYSEVVALEDVENTIKLAVKVAGNSQLFQE